MNKSELVDGMAAQSGLTKANCAMALDGLITSVTGALRGEQKVQITGFCSFELLYKEAHTGRNPSSGETIDVPAKYVVKIRPGSKLTDACNAG